MFLLIFFKFFKRFLCICQANYSFRLKNGNIWKRVFAFDLLSEMSKHTANLVQNPRNCVDCVCYKRAFDRPLPSKMDCFNILWTGNGSLHLWLVPFTGSMKTDSVIFIHSVGWWRVCFLRPFQMKFFINSCWKKAVILGLKYSAAEGAQAQ